MQVLDVTSFKNQIFDFETNSNWVFKGATPTIIDFYADWCGPCQRLSPILEELAVEYKDRLEIFKVDTEKSPELASLFGVRGIPALLFIPKSGEPSLASGFVPKDNLKQAIKDILNV